MSVRVVCDGCGRGIRAPDSMAGQSAACPNCATEIAIPRAAAGAEKPCPFCGETILLVAVKCKHCGEFLDGSRQDAVTTEATGKRWKLTQLTGGVLLLLGLASFAVMTSARSSLAALDFAWPIWAAGSLIYFAGRLGAWWYHG